MSTPQSEATFARGATRHRDCECCEHAAAEIERLLALVEGRFKGARLLRTGPDGRGAFEIAIRSDLAGLMADHLLHIMQLEGGQNFVQMEVTHPDAGPLTFTIEQRCGRSPAAQLAEIKTRTATLETDIRFLARRAERAGWLEPRTWRDTGVSANSLVSLAYGMIDSRDQDMPGDWYDYAACVRTVRRMPRHRRSRAVTKALGEARRHVDKTDPIVDRRRRWHDFRLEAAELYPNGVPRKYRAGRRRRW